jgi:hypothetical protein
VCEKGKGVSRPRGVSLKWTVTLCNGKPSFSLTIETSMSKLCTLCPNPPSLFPRVNTPQFDTMALFVRSAEEGEQATDTGRFIPHTIEGWNIPTCTVDMAVYDSLSATESRVALAVRNTIQIHDGTSFALICRLDLLDKVTQLGVFYTDNAPRLVAVRYGSISVYDADAFKVLHQIDTGLPASLTVYHEPVHGRPRLVVAMDGDGGGLLIADAETGDQVRPSFCRLGSVDLGV